MYMALEEAGLIAPKRKTITNYERIKSAQGIEELAKLLCRETEMSSSCDECPVREKCGVGHNGFRMWLKESE